MGRRETVRPPPSTPTVRKKLWTSRYGLSLAFLRGLRSFTTSHDGVDEGPEVLVGPVTISSSPVQITVIQ